MLLKGFLNFYLKSFMVFLLFEMIMGIGPKIYSGPSPNNNDDNFYQQMINFHIFITFRQMIDIGQNYIQEPTHSPTVSVFRSRFFLSTD